jgi:hypothetical protein
MSGIDQWCCYGFGHVCYEKRFDEAQVFNEAIIRFRNKVSFSGVDDELGRNHLLVKAKQNMKFNNYRASLISRSFGKNAYYSELKKCVATGKWRELLCELTDIGCTAVDSEPNMLYSSNNVHRNVGAMSASVKSTGQVADALDSRLEEPY